MDVADEFQEIAVHIYENCSVASLKQVPRPVCAAVSVTGIAKTDILDDAGQGDVSNLDSHVDMICHQAVRMDTMLKSFDALLKKGKESLSILLSEKDILAGVSAKYYVVAGTGVMDSGFSSHGVIHSKSKMPICQA